MHTFEQVREDILSSGYFAWDMEAVSKTGNPSDAKDPTKARATHIALAGPTKSLCVHVNEETNAFLCEFLTNPDLVGLVHNAPYDYTLLHYNKILDVRDFKVKLCDTLVLSWLVDEDAPHGLKYLVKRWCNITMTTYEEVSSSSPTMMKLNGIHLELNGMLKIYEKWEKKGSKIPWPTHSSPLYTRTAIRKQLREDAKERGEKMSAAEATNISNGIFSAAEAAKYHKAYEVVKASKQKEIAKLEIRADKDMMKYARSDAANLFKLFKKLVKVIKKEKTAHVVKVKMANRYETICMKIHGMPLDVVQLEDAKIKLEDLIIKYQESIFEIAGEEFNPGSSPELRRIMFDKLDVVPPVDIEWRGQQIPKFTKAGNTLLEKLKREDKETFLKIDCRKLEHCPDELKAFLSTDASTLARVSHPIAQAILNFKAASKIYSTYILGDIERVAEAGDGRVHGSFNSVGTGTGRWSCVSGGTRITTNKGNRAISSLRKTIECGLQVKSHNGQYNDILQIFQKGEVEMFEVEMDNGSVIKCTEDHRFLTNVGWKALKDIGEDDQIYTLYAAGSSDVEVASTNGDLDPHEAQQMEENA